MKYNKSTDSEHEIKLEPALVSILWRTGTAVIGSKAGLEVITSFVGSGASIEITGKSESGKKLGKISAEIRNNKYVGEIDIPDNLKIDDIVYFEANLSGNGLSGESNHIPVRLPIVVTNMKWSAAQARRGDIVTLSADIDGVRDGVPALVTIFEYDRDGAHDKITELKSHVENKRIEINWEYQYLEDTDEIPSESELQEYGKNYNPPEYFFTIEIDGEIFGQKQESGLLTFKDWIEIELIDGEGNPVGGAKYLILLADGNEISGSLDNDGYARIDDLPPGPFQVQFPDELIDM